MNIFKIIKRLFENTDRPGGWDMDKELYDERDWKFSVAFADKIFGGALPKAFRWTDEELGRIPFQGRILSCVSCTVSFINQFFSIKEGNNVFLSWAFIYKLVQHFNGGTRVRDNMNVQISSGQCENNLLPESFFNGLFGSEKRAQDRSEITHYMRENAKNYKTKGYFQINPRNRTELKTAILEAPVLIGVYTNSIEWQQSPIIKDTGTTATYGHVVALIGWDEEGDWIIADWDRKRPIKVLDKNFQIVTAYAILDIPDNFKATMLQAKKLQGTNKIYIILPNGKFQHVSSPAQWQALNEKKMIAGSIGEITAEELGHLEQEQEPLAILK